MNKLGIWGLVIAVAFVVSVLSANPVVEAVGGWQNAFDGLDTRITDLESSEHTHPLVLRFLDTSVRDVFTTVDPQQMVGIDGQLTKFIFRFDVGTADVPPIPVMAIVLVNNSPTALTCDVLAVKNTVVTCMIDTPVPVTSTDLISVGHQFIPGGPIVNQIGDFVHVAIHVTP